MTAWLSLLPWWLVAGLALGVAFTLLAAGLFAMGTRLFPGPDRDDGNRLTSDERRRAEIRAYLDALGEQYAEDHPVDGQVVAFYLPARKVAITFDAKAYFRIEDAGVEAVLVEHELPGAALGARLPFETPDPTPDDDAAGGPGERRWGPDGDRWAAGPGPDGVGAHGAGDDGRPVERAFAELGVPADASLADVKSAYRERVKHVHPDQGGDPDEFQRVREAYTVAKEAAE